MQDVAILSMGRSETSNCDEDLRAINAVIDANFPLRVCTKPRELFGLFEAGRKPIVVLDVAHSEEVNSVMLTQLLKTAFHCGIVLVVADTPDERIRGRSCGADVCLYEPVQGAELIGALNALHRRLGSDKPCSAVVLASVDMADVVGSRTTTAPVLTLSATGAPRAVSRHTALSARVWVLENGGWLLRAPDGNAVDLSTGERSFMIHLFRAPTRLIRRDQWDDVQPGHTLAEKTRRIDVMVSRLRRKVNRAAGTFPLHVRRGVGYQFAASCAIEGDALIEASPA